MWSGVKHGHCSAPYSSPTDEMAADHQVSDAPLRRCQLLGIIHQDLEKGKEAWQSSKQKESAGPLRLKGQERTG